MNSITELYNKALAHLGAKRLMSPDDASPVATACADAYPSDRDFTLRLHPWNCAVARYDLNRLTTSVEEVSPEEGAVYPYQLPSDCLRVLEASADTWRIEGSTLVTDETTCSIRYVRRIDNVREFDAGLAECIALKLAGTLALQGIGSRERAVDMERRFEGALAEARYIDAMERRRDRLSPVHLDRSRA